MRNRISSVLLLAALCVPVGCKGRDGRTAYVTLASADDLKVGAPVRFRGIEIGVVQKLVLQHAGVRAELLIQLPDAPVQSNDGVAVSSVGLFGDHAVEIIPASFDGLPLRDGDTLHAAPPDSLAPTRDALARAVVREFTQRFVSRDSTRSTAPRPSTPP